jgi:lysophospholipase L1-like esterase
VNTIQLATIISLATFLAAYTYGQVTGVGAMGDSFTDEYDIFTPWAYQGEGRNWVEQLALNRSSEMDFGAYNAASLGAPRYAGYAHNWARSGATTTTLLSEGQHTGLAAQVVNGDVSLVYLGIGTNDFANIQLGTVQLPGFGPFVIDLTNEYGPTYSGQRTDQQVAERVDNLVTNFTAALDALSSAAAKVVVGTAVDIGSVPSVRAAFPDALRRQRITDAMMTANAQITDIALSRGIPVVDFAALVNLYHSASPVYVGGIDGKSSGRFFLGDGVHPSTLIQGLFANAFIAAANEVYGTNFTPLSAAEILMNAGISPPDPLGATFDANSIVILPPSTMLPGDFNRNGTVDAADYVVWRKGLGTVYTQTDYDAWRANFGQTAAFGTTSVADSAVPEPAIMTLLLPMAIVGISTCRRGRPRSPLACRACEPPRRARCGGSESRPDVSRISRERVLRIAAAMRQEKRDQLMDAKFFVADRTLQPRTDGAGCAD